MATITSLASGQISSGSQITLTGVSCIPNDVLIFYSSSYASFGLSGTSGYTMSSLNGQTIIGAFPDLWADTGFGIQTTASTNNFVVSYSSSAPASVVLFRIRPDTGKVIQHMGRYLDFSNSASTSRSITTTQYVASGACLVGGYAVADDTYFTDSDTTNGAWSAILYSPSTGGTDLAAFGQSKVTTAEGAQTYGGSWVNAQSEYACGWLYVFFEVDAPYWGIKA